MALGRSARSSTIWRTKDWRAGMSKPLITAWNAPSAMRCQTVMRPVNAKKASAADWSIARAWVTISVRCRSHRSTSTPAIGAMREVGAWLKNATSPS